MSKQVVDTTKLSSDATAFDQASHDLFSYWGRFAPLTEEDVGTAVPGMSEFLDSYIQTSHKLTEYLVGDLAGLAVVGTSYKGGCGAMLAFRDALDSTVDNYTQTAAAVDDKAVQYSLKVG